MRPDPLDVRFTPESGHHQTSGVENLVGVLRLFPQTNSGDGRGRECNNQKGPRMAGLFYFSSSTAD
jgi:hypothetical protein